MQDNKNKDLIEIKDLMEMFNCKTTTATKIMKNIKKVSNILDIAGKCHRTDYLNWCAVNNKSNLNLNSKQINHSLNLIINELSYLKRSFSEGVDSNE